MNVLYVLLDICVLFDACHGHCVQKPGQEKNGAYDVHACLCLYLCVCVLDRHSYAACWLLAAA